MTAGRFPSVPEPKEEQPGAEAGAGELRLNPGAVERARRGLRSALAGVLAIAAIAAIVLGYGFAAERGTMIGLAAALLIVLVLMATALIARHRRALAGLAGLPAAVVGVDHRGVTVPAFGMLPWNDLAALIVTDLSGTAVRRGRPVLAARINRAVGLGLQQLVLVLRGAEHYRAALPPAAAGSSRRLVGSPGLLLHRVVLDPFFGEQGDRAGLIVAMLEHASAAGVPAARQPDYGQEALYLLEQFPPTNERMG